MDRVRTLLLRIAYAALMGLTGLSAVSTASAAPDRGAENARRGTEKIAIPFKHAMGDTYGLSVTREALRDGLVVSSERHELSVRVRSPLDDGWLIDVRHCALIKNGTRFDLRERTEANAALLDELGGGVLRLHVDRRGTALRVLNWTQVDGALRRTAERVIDERVTKHGLAGDALARARKLLAVSLARPAAEPILMADWNIAYAACGVRLLPARAETRRIDVPRADGGPAVAAVDRRSLTPTYDERGAARHLRFVSDVQFGEAGRIRFGAAEAFLTERAVIDFDRKTHLIKGERVRTLRRNGRASRDVVRFAETATPEALDTVVPRPIKPTTAAPIAEARR